MHHRLSRLVAFALVMAAPCVAWASFGEVYGFGSRASAMGGAGGSSSNDVSALYYNIAAMSRGRGGVQFGLYAGLDDVTIRLKPRPSGYDLPDRGVDSPRIPTASRLSARADLTDIANQYQALVGGVFTLGVPKLRVGFLLMTPVDGLGTQQARFPDEREQYFSNQLQFELIGNRTQHMTILGGAAYQVLSWLSVGAGLSILPNAATRGYVYLPDPSQQALLDMSVTNEQGVSLGFNAGLLIRPNDVWSLGLSFRGENAFRLGIQNQVQIKGFQNDPASFPVVQDVNVTVNYSPDTVTASATWNDGPWLLTTDVRWTRWSGYVNHQGETTSSFKDTVSASVGGEYRRGETIFRAGVSWVPSPVKDQTGRTNFVDNDRVHVALGGGHPFELVGRSVELSWHLGVLHLMPRDTNKSPQSPWPVCAPGVSVLCDEIPDDTRDPVTGAPDPAYAGLQTGNPGFPGWQSFGRLLTFGADLRWRF